MTNTSEQNEIMASEHAIFLKHLPKDVLQSMIESRSKAKDGAWIDSMEQAGVFSIHNMVETVPMIDGSTRTIVLGDSPVVTGSFPLMSALAKCLSSSDITYHDEDPFNGRSLSFNGVKPIGCKQMNASQEFKDAFSRIVAGYLFESEWKDENVELHALAKNLSNVESKKSMEDRLTGTAGVLAVIASAMGDTKSLKGLLDRFENLPKVVMSTMVIGNAVNDSTCNPMLSAYEYNRPDSLQVFLDAGCKIDDICKHTKGPKGMIHEDILTNMLSDMSAYGALTLPSFLEKTIEALKETDSYQARLEEIGRGVITKRSLEVYLDVLDEMDFFKSSSNYLTALAFSANNLHAIKKLRPNYDWNELKIGNDREIEKTIKENPIYTFYQQWTFQGAPDFHTEEEYNSEVTLWLKDCLKAGKGVILTNQDTRSFPYILSEVKNYAGIIVCLDAGHDPAHCAAGNISLNDVAENDETLEKLMRSYRGKKAAYNILDEIYAGIDIKNGPAP